MNNIENLEEEITEFPTDDFLEVLFENITEEDINQIMIDYVGWLFTTKYVLDKHDEKIKFSIINLAKHFEIDEQELVPVMVRFIKYLDDTKGSDTESEFTYNFIKLHAVKHFIETELSEE